MELTQLQKDLLVGTLLGDGNLSRNVENDNWRYRALHTDKKLDYLEHKYEGHSNAMRICTEGFSDEDVMRLQKALKDVYGIETTTTRDNDLVDGKRTLVGLRICINEKASAAFRELIEPHLVDSMRYRVSDGKRGHL